MAKKIALVKLRPALVNLTREEMVIDADTVVEITRDGGLIVSMRLARANASASKVKKVNIDNVLVQIKTFAEEIADAPLPIGNP